MLMVSELLRVARDERSVDTLRRGTPARFGAASGRVQVVVWNLASHCNMTCPHCYASAGRRPSALELSTAEAEGVLDQLADLGVRQLIFSGGEPLLRDDLLHLAAYGRARGVVPQLSTNGVLIDEDVAGRLAEAGFTYVGVSIDGLPAFNDPYRGLARGFERALDGLRHSRAAGLKTGLRLTLSRHNRDQLAPMLDVAERAADRFYLSHLQYAGRAHRMASADLAPDETRATLGGIFAHADALVRRGSPLAIVTGGNDSDGPLLLGWIRERYGEPAATRALALLRARGGNSAGEKLVAIDFRGRVHPDQFWTEMVLGDVRTQRLSDILAHPLRRQLAERERHLTGRCAACAFRDLCRGSHRERALAHHGDIWASDPSCVLTDAEVFERPMREEQLPCGG